MVSVDCYHPSLSRLRDLKEKEPHFEVVFDSEASKVVDRLVAELVLYHIVVVAASAGCVF